MSASAERALERHNTCLEAPCKSSHVSACVLSASKQQRSASKNDNCSHSIDPLRQGIKRFSQAAALDTRSVTIAARKLASTAMPAGFDARHTGAADFGYSTLGSQAGESTSYGSEEDDAHFGRPRRCSFARPFLAPLHRLFARGHDVESADDHHHYTREERQKLSNIESIDYLPPNSAVYRAWLARQPYRYLLTQ